MSRVVLGTVLVFLASALAAAACGPNSGADDKFVFTAVPYTVVAKPPQCGICSTFYTLSDDCEWYAADQLSVLVLPAGRDKFVAWATKAGFRITYETTPFAESIAGTPVPGSLFLQVPLGSVPDAVRAAGRRPGVVAADKNGTAWIPEGVPDFIRECEHNLPADHTPEWAATEAAR